MNVSVSKLDAFKRFEDGNMDEDEFVSYLEGRIKEEKMRAINIGNAFHELVLSDKPIDGEIIEANGFAFDGDSLRKVREYVDGYKFEIPIQKTYSSDIEITGRLDFSYGIAGGDLKTTSRIELERYMDSYQWRLYLWMSGLEIFSYVIVELNDKYNTASVNRIQVIDMYPYIGMENDCLSLISRFLYWLGKIT